MAEDDEFKKAMKKAGRILQDELDEGMSKIRTLRLTGEEVGKVLDMSDDEIKEFVADKGFNFDEHYISIRALDKASEGYMKTPQQLRDWLKRGSLN